MREDIDNGTGHSKDVLVQNCKSTRFSLDFFRESKYFLLMPRKRFHTTLDEDLLKKLRKLAADHGRSVNVLLDEGIPMDLVSCS